MENEEFIVVKELELNEKAKFIENDIKMKKLIN